jgi:CheY-like chemotaxis protein
MEILLVEDLKDDIELTLRVLNKSKLENRIHITRDGQEALDYMYRKGKYEDENKAPMPDLILLDIKLPKVDGLEVLKQLKSDPKFKRIPTVILTVSQREEDINKSYDLGANSYIVKSVAFDEFNETIENIERYWALTNTPPVAESRGYKH